MAQYTIPSAVLDLGKDETHDLICTSLLSLQEVSSELFGQITKRVDECHEQICALNRRLNSIEDQLTRSLDSDKVCSEPQYLV